MTLPASALAVLPPDAAGSRHNVARIIAAELDSVRFFEQLTPGADGDALLAILGLTSPSLAEVVGNPALVPEGDRAYGPGSGWIMPAFTRRVRPSRFTDGRFGVWYVAWDTRTAVAETMYHTSRRLQETHEPAQDVSMQILTADLAGFAAVLARVPEPLWSAIHDPASYLVSQQVGTHVHDRGSEAIVYHSVRRPGGVCVGVLKPRAVRHCRRSGFVTFHWDGSALTA